MSDVLTGPLVAAAVLVCVAGVAKLRAPAGARRALIVLGLPARAGQVRALAVIELAVGLAALLIRTPVTALVLAGLYAAFALAALGLRRRGSACGCFGESETPASSAQAALSGALALVCAAAVIWPAHRLGWMVQRPVLAVAIAGCVYAMVLIYTQLPLAWGAWRPQ